MAPHGVSRRIFFAVGTWRTGSRSCSACARPASCRRGRQRSAACSGGRWRARSGSRTGSRGASVAAALAFVVVAMIAGYRSIGLPPVVIVGGSGIAGFVMWVRTYLRRPVAPEVILPPFLLTVAALEAHMAEEYLTGFGPAMSRLFDISWTEHSFLIVFAFIGPTLYSLTALGLFYRVPLAGFLAWFIFIGPGVAEFTHFIFPLLKPAIQPDLPATISQAVSNGRYVADMRNYWLHTTGTYYFPGLYTAVLPMIPGIWAIRRLVRASREP